MRGKWGETEADASLFPATPTARTCRFVGMQVALTTTVHVFNIGPSQVAGLIVDRVMPAGSRAGRG
jgi:hypothetical protein